MLGDQLKKIMVLLAVLAGLVFFQNCEFASPDGDTYSSEANGDGYSGITAEYPDVAESGSTISVRILDKIVSGYSFTIVEGDAQIKTYNYGNAALVEIASDYIGSLIISVVGGGNSGVFEIQVVAPDPLNQVIRHSTFGTEMVMVGNQIAASIPKKNIDEVTNAGRVVLFDVDEGTGKTQFSHKIEGVPGDVVEDYQFGHHVAGSNNDLIVASPNTGNVYHYQRNPADPESGMQLVSTFSRDPSIRFGSDIVIEQNTMIVGAKFANNNDGQVLVYRRADFDTPFSLAFTIDPEVGYRSFGRRLELKGDLLFVSTIRLETTAENEKGAVHVYDLSTQNIIRRFSRTSGIDGWGRTLHFTGQYLFASTQDLIEATNEYVDIYQYDALNSTFTWLQRLNNPEGLTAQSNFGKAVVSDDVNLFIGAPKASTRAQQQQGKVYSYKLDPTSGLFRRTGFVRHDPEEYEVVTSLGRSLVLTETSLFIPIMGKQKGKNSLNGAVYILPLQ